MIRKKRKPSDQDHIKYESSKQFDYLEDKRESHSRKRKNSKLTAISPISSKKKIKIERSSQQQSSSEEEEEIKKRGRSRDRKNRNDFSDFHQEDILYLKDDEMIGNLDDEIDLMTSSRKYKKSKRSNSQQNSSLSEEAVYEEIVEYHVESEGEVQIYHKQPSKITKKNKSKYKKNYEMGEIEFYEENHEKHKSKKSKK